MTLTAAQTWLIAGGMFNLFFSTIAAYALFWVRTRDPQKPAPRFGLITHTSSLTNGVLLLALSVAIPHTGFPPDLNTGLAIAQFLATLFSNGRNVLLWAQGLEDGFYGVSETRRRLRGVGNMINLVVMASILYGVVRTALGF